MTPLMRLGAWLRRLPEETKIKIMLAGLAGLTILVTALDHL